MHLHILGICGTFMGGLALIARAAGHTVTGCDAGVYPPMSTQLEEQGIRLIEGFDAGQIEIEARSVHYRQRGHPRQSADGSHPRPGPALYVGAAMAGRKCFAQASMCWRLPARMAKPRPAPCLPGSWNMRAGAQFLDRRRRRRPESIGALPARHRICLSSRPTNTTPHFSTNARSLFITGRARPYLNNLEYDHADIFPDLTAIETQFHHLVRTIPATGHIIRPTNCEPPGPGPGARLLDADRNIRPARAMASRRQRARIGHIDIVHNSAHAGTITWQLTGEHNRMNALAALAAAEHVGRAGTARALPRFRRSAA